MSTESRPAPYPADTKAKGWRFELDLEQVMQSDTWALAAPDERPWLFMLWTTAWQQTPCGSMPSEPKLICARLGMTAKQFEKSKEVILRGWWLADDGRLYHDTIATRVKDMLGRKNGERERKANYRAQKEAEERLRDINAKTRDTTDVPDLSHGTGTGQTLESQGTDDTGTGTGTGTGLTLCNLTPLIAGAEISPGEVCKAMRQSGLADVNPSHPLLRTLLDAGADAGEFTAAADKAVKGGKGFAYALAIVEGERRRAADVVGQVRTGPMPTPINRQVAIEARNRAVVAAALAQGA